MDMLVKLYDLPSAKEEIEKLSRMGIKIIRALPPNKKQIIDWVEAHTSKYAASEADCCFKAQNPTMFIAVKNEKIIGYACYNATAPDFFGPTEVLESEQGQGVGKALLIASLSAMRDEGYAYAIIGGVGPVEFYEKCVGATVIENSTPGIYENMLKLE